MHNHIVRNVEGTSGLRPPFGFGQSWISYWQKFTGNHRTTCAHLGCSNQATVGAHVEFLDQLGPRGIYIVPLCSSCNNWRNGDQMTIDSRTALVEA